MSEIATKWQPVLGIEDGFGSISFSYIPQDKRAITVIMNGARNLCLSFTGVVALHWEDECPGNFPRPKVLPMLRPRVTFPLLKIEQSQWLAEYPMFANRAHFFMISSDDLVHVIAKPAVEAYWEE